MANVNPKRLARDGLYEKFHVIRTDGRSAVGEKHHGCRYFVLDLDHDPHVVAALTSYIRVCQFDYPALAADLMVIRDEIAKRIRAAPEKPE